MMARQGSGWVLFAAIILGVVGVMRLFDAIWAFSYHGVLPEGLEGAIFGHSLKTYGWVWLIIAAIYIAAAFMVLSGSEVARWFGIVAAAIGSFSAIWWMPYYPVWSFVYIAVGVLVIYALATFGGRSELA
jgi:hypothetical protein